MQSGVHLKQSTVHDLYGLVGILTPNVTDAEIRKTYEAMVKKLQPQLPSNAVSDFP